MGAHGTVLMARQTWPPSWSVAAINLCRVTPRTVEITVVIDSGELALRFRFTTSSPPNWRCYQSANSAGVSGPSKPAMMTAPTSSSSVSPPGPSCVLGEVGGEDTEDGSATPGPPQETTTTPTSRGANQRGSV